MLRAVNEPQRSAEQAFIGIVETELETLSFGPDAAVVWARLYDLLRRQGRLIGERDLQFAAIAMAGGHSVMTGNAGEFSRVPDLVVLEPPAIPPSR